MTKQPLYEYVVEGFDDFPLDMLRHGRAWPATESDSHEARRTNRMRRVRLRGLSDPDRARWASFRWVVLFSART